MQNRSISPLLDPLPTPPSWEEEETLRGIARFGWIALQSGSVRSSRDHPRLGVPVTSRPARTGRAQRPANLQA